MLEYPDGQHIVWSFDGNIKYLIGLKHSILFVVAVIILLVLWLPYTFTLLFIQCLRRYSHHYGLRWVNKLTPFFDSYTGPLKDKHHYWIGLGLLARLVLLLTSTVTLITMPYTICCTNSHSKCFHAWYASYQCVQAMVARPA